MAVIYVKLYQCSSGPNKIDDATIPNGCIGYNLLLLA